TLAYMAFPREHWRCLRTNNPLERVMRELRRRTRGVGSFPDGESALMLVAARRGAGGGRRRGSREDRGQGRGGRAGGEAGGGGRGGGGGGGLRRQAVCRGPAPS